MLPFLHPTLNTGDDSGNSIKQPKNKEVHIRSATCSFDKNTTPHNTRVTHRIKGKREKLKNAAIRSGFMKPIASHKIDHVTTNTPKVKKSDRFYVWLHKIKCSDNKTYMKRKTAVTQFSLLFNSHSNRKKCLDRNPFNRETSEENPGGFSPHV